MQNAKSTQHRKATVTAVVTAVIAAGLVEPLAAFAGKLSNNHSEVMASTPR